MLEIVWIQKFIANSNKSPCKYKIQQLIKINIYYKVRLISSFFKSIFLPKDLDLMFKNVFSWF